MHAVLTVAGKEFRDGLRNRWVLAITLVFALLAVGIGYFGAAASGTVGFTSVATTVVSLASLAVFLIPLIALLLAYDTIVGEEEQGTLLLLLTYPIGRTQLLAGKFLGHTGIIAVSSVLGFGLAGVFIAVLAEELGAAELWQPFAYFVFSAILLGLVFIAFAYLISVLVAEKTRAAGLALIVWFVFVLVFDLALLGLLVATEGRVGADVFPYLLLLNPTDVFRIANLAGFEATQVHAGLTSLAAPALFNPTLLAGVLLAWIAVPFALAAWLFRRRAA
jgi:Cu-processing system permease protein